MNKYITDYDTCLEKMVKPIVLAGAFTAISLKGKELIYEPSTLHFVVIEYTLDPTLTNTINDGNITEYYYSASVDVFYMKKIVTQSIMYDLTEAVETYNEIEIPMH